MRELESLESGYDRAYRISYPRETVVPPPARARIRTRHNTRRLKPRLYRQNPPPRVEEDRAVEIILFSSVRGGGLRLCRRGFNRRFIFAHTVSTQDSN
jgi:hypothetical protein